MCIRDRSKPILVTVGLFSGLGYWNDWTNAQYYISDSRMLSVQALLNRMVQDIQALLANSCLLYTSRCV